MVTFVTYVMLIWVGGGYGGPATIQGFKSMEACQAEIKPVLDSYDPQGTTHSHASCLMVDLGSQR